MSKWNEGRTVPPDEPGLVTHTPAGTIIVHGGAGTGYRRWGCRCKACQHANAVSAARRRKEREQETPPDSVQHGKPATYANWGCRCEPCTVAWSANCKRQYWARKGKAAE